MRRMIIPMSAVDYLKTRKNLWFKILVALIPALASGLILCRATTGATATGTAPTGSNVVSISTINFFDVFSDFVNVQISAVAILISFSIAIITILITADNTNINRLKETNSKDCKPLRGKPISLFQVLLSNITYNVLVEVLYLGILIALLFVRLYASDGVCKILMAICVFFVTHILHILLESVGQMYLTFWKHEDTTK